LVKSDLLINAYTDKLVLSLENSAGCDWVGNHIVHECAWSQLYFFRLLHTPWLLFAVSTFPMTLGLIWRRNSWQKWWL